MVEVDGELLLFDVGITIKRLKVCMGEINRSIDDIEYIFITHRHGDHFKRSAINKTGCHGVFHGGTMRIGSAYVTSFKLSHDMPCVGYTITDGHGNKIAIAADSGCFPEESIPYLFDCKLIQIEFNYDRDMLEQSPYNEKLKDRIRGNLGHMENRKSREVLECVAWDGLKYVVPAHLSDTNNDTRLVAYEAQKAVPGAEVIVAGHGVTKMVTLI